MKSTKSGFDFQQNVENKLLLSNMFGKCVDGITTIYSYTDLINQGISDVDKFLLSAEEDIFLMKNYPLFNLIDERIEFCIKAKHLPNIITNCYIECKFYDVNGTAYQKLHHYFAEHNITHHNNTNSYMILVYDGNDFFGDTKTNLHVQNIRENYIKYNYRQLILGINDFEEVFLRKLRQCRDMSEIFKEIKKDGY